MAVKKCVHRYSARCWPMQWRRPAPKGRVLEIDRECLVAPPAAAKRPGAKRSASGKRSSFRPMAVFISGTHDLLVRFVLHVWVLRNQNQGLAYGVAHRVCASCDQRDHLFDALGMGPGNVPAPGTELEAGEPSEDVLGFVRAVHRATQPSFQRCLEK